MITTEQFNIMEVRNEANKLKGPAADTVKQSVPDDAVELEKDLHRDIFDYCRNKKWIVLHGAMSERTHRTPGEFDFVIIADGGRVFLIECKTRKGKLSHAQLAMKVHAEWLGHKPAVVRSMTEFLEAINNQTGG